MKRLAHLLSLFLLIPLMLAGCQDYTPFWGGDFEGDQTDNTLRPASDYFSFNTTKQVSLSVDYGTRGSQALIEVYTENPAYIGEDGNTYFHDDAVFKAYHPKTV